MNPNSNIGNKKGEPRFACKLCPKKVSKNDDVISCELCQTLVHIKCNYLNYIDYN